MVVFLLLCPRLWACEFRVKMRTLDIEFEGQQHPQAPLNNGFRPHGGYRGERFKTSKVFFH